MKRWIISALTVVGLATGLVAAVAAPANAAYAGCDLAADYIPGDVSNSLTFSLIDNPRSWHMPLRRAGNCGRLFTEYTGTFNGPTCVHMKANTYNEDRSIRVNGAWVTHSSLGEVHRLRYPIDRNRIYRVYIRNCNIDYRQDLPNGYFKPGFRVYVL